MFNLAWGKIKEPRAAAFLQGGGTEIPQFSPQEFHGKSTGSRQGVRECGRGAANWRCVGRIRVSRLFALPETPDNDQTQDKTNHLRAEKQLQSNQEADNVVHFDHILWRSQYVRIIEDKYIPDHHGIRVEHEMESEEAAVTLMLIYSPPEISMTGNNFYIRIPSGKLEIFLIHKEKKQGFPEIGILVDRPFFTRDHPVFSSCFLCSSSITFLRQS
jgi:hypothetical protein